MIFKSIWRAGFMGILIAQAPAAMSDAFESDHVADEVFRCESLQGELNYCDTGALIQSLALLQEFGGTPCIDGRTFGFRDARIWVRGGCRGDFIVSRTRQPIPPPPPRPTPQPPTQRSVYIFCGSNPGTQTNCPAPGRIISYEIIAQNGWCFPNSTFFIFSNVIMVRQGCRAQFKVYY